MDPSKPRSFSQRFSESRPTKTAVFWACAACIVATLIVGFTWGGWVRGATAKSMGVAMAEEAVTKRLAPMCEVQVNGDPARVQKIKALKDLSSYERGDYVKKQGWANLPGDAKPDDKVAEECAKLVVENNR
jgi:hypothetical protein